jgi:hypothetical protein
LAIFHVPDDFSKVRLKLKQAEVCSDTDLNSGMDDDNVGSGRRFRTRRGQARAVLESDSDDNESPQPFHTNLPVPPSKHLTLKQFQERAGNLIFNLFYFLVLHLFN